MKVLGFAGYSGAGKTTLIEGVLRELTARGLRVSVVKHAHHRFDIDHAGKDTFRHRSAGAYEVIAASTQRMALMREWAGQADFDVHHLISHLDPTVDWVLVEGFKEADLPKLEVWRPSTGHEPLMPTDTRILAIATDDASQLADASVTTLDIGNPSAVVDWMLAQGERLNHDAKEDRP